MFRGELLVPLQMPFEFISVFGVNQLVGTLMKNIGLEEHKRAIGDDWISQ